jgi:hypothetical protein
MDFISLRCAVIYDKSTFDSAYLNVSRHFHLRVSAPWFENITKNHSSQNSAALISPDYSERAQVLIMTR